MAEKLRFFEERKFFLKSRVYFPIIVSSQCETEYMESRYVYGLALQIAWEHGTRGLYCLEYNNIASIFVMEENYEEALRYLELAQQVMPDSEKPMGAYIYLNKTVAYRKLDRMDEALQAYKMAVEQYDAGNGWLDSGQNHSRTGSTGCQNDSNHGNDCKCLSGRCERLHECGDERIFGKAAGY